MQGTDSGSIPGQGTRSHMLQLRVRVPQLRPSADKSKNKYSKQTHFTNKGPYSQSYGFSSNHIPMWELDHKEGWEPKNWCFWTMVLEKTLERPLDCKEIKPVNPKGNKPEYSLEGLMLKLKLQWFGHLMSKDPDAEKDWRQQEKETTEIVCWMAHCLNGHEFEQMPGDGEGQGSLACCSPWGVTESDTTEWLNNNIPISLLMIFP